MADYIDRLLDKVYMEEGYESSMYKCPAGKWTIGPGINLETSNMPDEVGELWATSILDALNRRMSAYGWFVLLDDNRRIAILDMAYQMGVSGLFKFKKTIEHLEHKRYEEAADEMLDSKWAINDSPNRALRNSEIIRTGVL